MGVPISTRVLTLATVPSGVSGGKVIELPLTGKGYLSRLVVNEIVGAHEGFTVDVYDKATVFNLDGSNGVDVLSEINHRVIPQQVAAAAATNIFFFDPTGVPFVNRDGTLSDSQRKLYVRIKPAGTGNKTYEISAGGTQVN